MISNGEDDIFIVKFDEQGTEKWADSFGESRNDGVEEVASTNDGVIIVGEFSDTTITINDIELTNNSTKYSARDIWIAKYSNNGEVQWARNIGGARRGFRRESCRN